MSLATPELELSREAVVANPKLLLHKAFDDAHPHDLSYQAAALIHHGENIVAAVNVPWIPELPPTGNREVFMRWDFRYGTDDYIQWPQPFSPIFPHFPAILRKPKYSDSFEILWKPYHAHCPEFTSSTAHYVTLSPYDLSAFENIEAQLDKEVVKFLDKPQSKSPESYRDTILTRQGWAHTFLARVRIVPMTRRELWRSIVEVQCFLLELHAALHWETVCRPRILGLKLPATTVADTIGVFTSDPAIVKQCVVVGLPVWMILDIDHLPHTRIDKLVEFEKAELHVVCDEGTIKHPTIFRGKATNPRRLQEIYLNSRHVLHTADVFATNYNPPALRSDGPRSLNSTMANADSLRGIQVSYHPYRSSHLTKEHRKNIFTTLVLKPSVSPLLPLIHQAWLMATAAVTLDDFPNELPNDGGFAFANPQLFFDSDELKAGVKKAMVYQWLQLRPVMLHRVGPAVPTSISGSVSNRIWRRALQLPPSSFDAIRRDTSKKQNSAEKREGVAFLEASLLAAGVTAELLQTPPTWRGDPVASPDHLEEQVWKEAIWELSQLNFRFEILALDRRLCNNGSIRDSPDRHKLLLDCLIPPPFARAFIVLEFHQASQGLGHHDIQQRLPQLLHLRTLMSSWTPSFSGFDEVSVSSDDATLMKFEQALYTFYVRRFFNIFGRIPVVPHYL